MLDRGLLKKWLNKISKRKEKEKDITTWSACLKKLVSSDTSPNRFMKSCLWTSDCVWLDSARVFAIITHCCLLGSFCLNDIRSVIFFWSPTGILACSQGWWGHIVCTLWWQDATAQPAFCVLMFARRERVFVRLKTLKERVLSGESARLCLCEGATQHQLRIPTKIEEPAPNYSLLLQPKATLFIAVKDRGPHRLLSHLRIEKGGKKRNE